MNQKKFNRITLLLSFLLAFLSNTFAAGFTDNHNDNVITGWTNAGSRPWTEANGTVNPANSNPNSGLLINNYNCANNGTLEVTYTTEQWNGFKGGVVFRYTSPTSFYFVTVLPGNQWNSYIKFCKNSFDINSGTTVAANFQINTTVNLKIVIQGSTFKFYTDNVLRGQISDSTHPSGKVGYGYAPDWVSYTSFDNITWTDNQSQVYQLTTSTAGTGTVTPASGSFNSGDTVRLTATPAAGWRFDSWSGDASGSVNPLSVTMNSNKNITATFVRTTYSLTTATSGTGTVTPASGTFNSGDTVRLTATPAAGWRFDSWSGDASGSVNPLSVTMNSNKNITATFVRTTYSLTTATSGTGTVTPASGTFNSGDTVRLTATPAAGWRFDSWSGDASGSANPLSVTMSSNKNITATFVRTTYSLTTATSGTGTITPASGTFNSGDTVRLTATPAAGWTFDSWSGDASGSVNPLYITMNSNKNITATFVRTTYSLSTATSGSGTVTPASGTFNSDDTVLLTATPAAGWRFDSWSGDASGSVNPLYITMNSNKNITATFTKIPHYRLTASVDGSGSVSPDSGSFEEHSIVRITATALPGWRFDYWSGDISNSVNPVNVTIDSNISVTAHFVQIPREQYSLTVNTAGNGTVSPGSGSYVQGSSVLITATPAAGWVFDHWSGAMSNSVNPLTVVMDSNITIIANFVPAPVPNSQRIAITARLYDENGAPAGNHSPVNYDAIVKLCDSASAGNVLYTESFLASNDKSVTVENGYFVVRLGEGYTNDDLKAVLLRNQNLWVEIQVGTDILTRVPLTGAAYLLTSR